MNRGYFYDWDFGCDKNGIYSNGDNESENGKNDYLICISDWRKFFTVGNITFF